MKCVRHGRGRAALFHCTRGERAKRPGKCISSKNRHYPLQHTDNRSVSAQSTGTIPCNIQQSIAMNRSQKKLEQVSAHHTINDNHTHLPCSMQTTHGTPHGSVNMGGRTHLVLVRRGTRERPSMIVGTSMPSEHRKETQGYRDHKRQK